MDIQFPLDGARLAIAMLKQKKVPGIAMMGVDEASEEVVLVRTDGSRFVLDAPTFLRQYRPLIFRRSIQEMYAEPELAGREILAAAELIERKNALMARHGSVRERFEMLSDGRVLCPRKNGGPAFLGIRAFVRLFAARA